MNLEVLYFGKLRDIVGISREKVALGAGICLDDVITRLGELHGETFAHILKTAEGLRILINGQEYKVLDGMATKLKENDSVVFLPPIYGG
jgi:molybdopterin synthase sulfur carrier subunit